MTIQGRPFSAYGASEAEAVQNLDEKVSRNLRDSYTFGQWMEERYLTSIQSTSKAHQDKARWAISHLGRMARLPIEKVTRHELQTLLNSKKLSHDSLKTLRSVWSAGLNLAEADDVIPKNPMRFVRLKRQQPKPKQVYDAKALKQLIDHSRGYAAHPTAILGGLLGLRIGEIQKLKPEHFKEKGKLIVPGTKTMASIRELPLHPKILEEIGDYHFPLAPKDAARSRENLKRAAYRAQLEIQPNNHMLRHSFASILEWLGCPLDVRARLLGHGKKSMTERYSHAEWRTWQKWCNLLVEYVYQLPKRKVGYVKKNEA